MRISNKREALARGLRRLGLLGLIERAARRRCVLVLSYHRIGEPERQPYYAPIVSATAEAFREQVALLRDRFRLLGPADWLDVAGPGYRPEGPTALITFDDGYRDNLEVAVPILRELGAPAAFFLATDFLDRPNLPWWDHVALALNRATCGRLTLERPERLEIDLATTPVRVAITAVIMAYLRAARPDEPELLAHLDERAGVAIDPEAHGRSLFLDWAGARQLVASGMAVGSHTRSHPSLAKLPEDRQRAELVESRAILRRELGADIAALAYPFGGTSDIDATTRRLAVEAGYRLGVTLTPGANRPGSIDPLMLRRLLVGSADTPTLLRARLDLAMAFGASPL